MRHITAVLLVILWMPMALHCTIGLEANVPADTCCGQNESIPDHPENTSCCDEVCGLLENGSFRPDSGHIDIQLPAEMLAFVQPLPPEPKTSPPPFAHGQLIETLSVAWQFSFRTAAPPRAPSFVS